MNDVPAGVNVPSFNLTPNQTAQMAGIGTALLETEEERKKRFSGIPKMKKGGKVKSASARADGCAQRGKTKGKIV